MNDAPSNAPVSRWLVTTDWLAARLDAPDVVVVDGSFYLPAQKRDAAAEYLAGHIPGAVPFDIDAASAHPQIFRTWCLRVSNSRAMWARLGLRRPTRLSST